MPSHAPRRALLLVLDSLGVGGAADAAAFGDAGADTLGHLAAARPLDLPHLERLGLGAAAHAATGVWPAGFLRRVGFTAAYGCCDEQSAGKDTPSGHWEMAGLPVDFDWGLFPAGPPSFPEALLDGLIERAGLPGVLGDCALSGTTILEQLGDEHIATGKPIVYTSADSVMQIAAHEEHFGLERLYGVCEIARELVDVYRIGRVIARPFVGADGVFERTLGRRDWTTPPHAPTLLDVLADSGRAVVGIGKIHDIFAGRGVTQSFKGGRNEGVHEATQDAWKHAPDGALVFSNFVDFDQLFGHRRDVEGYARALETFDAWLPALEAALRPGDLAVITADHGCDPTWPGTDHTRERVPLLCFGPDVEAQPLGVRATFADIGQTIAAWLGVRPLPHGRAMDLGPSRGAVDCGPESP